LQEVQKIDLSMVVVVDVLNWKDNEKEEEEWKKKKNEKQ
jgi:hypothetical protein